MLKYVAGSLLLCRWALVYSLKLSDDQIFVEHGLVG